MKFTVTNNGKLIEFHITDLDGKGGGYIKAVLFEDAANSIMRNIGSAVLNSRAHGIHPYYSRRLQKMKNRIVIASTNEPCLEDTLKAWGAQTEEFVAHVVIDCANDASWDIARRFSNDKRFIFTLSPWLQGLTRVWNVFGFYSPFQEFLTFVGADTQPPPNYLTVANGALSKHPDWGFVVPSVGGEDGLWPHTLTTECAVQTSGFSVQYGEGGLGTIIDWRNRARLKFNPHRLSDVPFTHTSYSIQDKGPVRELEARDELQKVWGHDVVEEFFNKPLPIVTSEEAVR